MNNKEQLKYYFKLRDKIASMSNEELKVFTQKLRDKVCMDEALKAEYLEKLNEVDEYFNQPTGDFFAVGTTILTCVALGCLPLFTNFHTLAIIGAASTPFVCLGEYILLKAGAHKILPCSVKQTLIQSRIDKLTNKDEATKKLLNEIDPNEELSRYATSTQEQLKNDLATL